MIYVSLSVARNIEGTVASHQTTLSNYFGPKYVDTRGQST